VSRVVWKFGLTPGAIRSLYARQAPFPQMIEMPADAEVLTAGLQGPNIVIWARCSPDAPRRPRRFWLYATGDAMEQLPMRYVATIEYVPGFILHVFTEGA
jgi:hypothetical protein